MQNDKLLPCPFCGGEAQVVVDYETEKSFLIQCIECQVITREFKTDEEVIKHWNTRKPMERIVEQLEEHKLIVEIDDDHIVPESDVDEFFELEVVALSSAIEIVKGGVDNG